MNNKEQKIESSTEALPFAKLAVSSSGFISGCCEGEKCSACGKPATNKLEETIFHDDPYPMRHPLTAYVCKEHFRMIVGSLG